MLDINKRAKTGEQIEGFQNQLNNSSQQLIQLMRRVRETKEKMELDTTIYSIEDIDIVKSVYNDTLDYLNLELSKFSKL